MIVNYLITKIEANRDIVAPANSQISITDNISLTNLEKDDKLNILRFSFRFDASVMADQKNFGKIGVEGVLFYAGDKLEEIFKGWNEGKKIEPSLAVEVTQAASDIGSIEALALSKSLQLPPVITLPRVTAQTTENQSQEPPKKSSKK